MILYLRWPFTTQRRWPIEASKSLRVHFCVCTHMGTWELCRHLESEWVLAAQNSSLAIFFYLVIFFIFGFPLTHTILGGTTVISYCHHMCNSRCGFLSMYELVLAGHADYQISLFKTRIQLQTYALSLDGLPL